MANKVCFQLLVLIAAFNFGFSDYPCVCNYNVEKPVYFNKSSIDPPLGYMYEFDCKASAYNDTEGGWLSIVYDQQVGYVQDDSQVETQVCSGEPAPDEILKTTESALPAMNVSSVASTSTTAASTSPSGSPSTTATTTIMDSTITSTTLPTTTTSAAASSTGTTVTVSSSSLPSSTSFSTSSQSSSSTTSSSPSVSTTEMSTIAPSPSTTVSSSPSSSNPTTISVTSDLFSSSSPTTSTATMTTVSTSTMTQTSTPVTTASTSAATSTTTRSTEHTSTSTASPATSAVSYGCATEYFQHLNQVGGVLFGVDHICYELVESRRSWVDAEQDCRQRGGHLAHIANADEQNAIHQIVEQYHSEHGVWIGLHDRDDEEQFVWTSGDPVTYTNWDPLRKDPLLHGTEDCVGLGVDIAGYSGGAWEDLRCGMQLHYVCQFVAVPVIPTTTPVPGTYSDGNPNLCPTRVKQLANQYGTLLVQHGNSCYELLHNKVTWEHAEAFCQDAGGHLAQIGDADEQAYIQAFMQHHNPDKAVWIGLHDLNVESQFEWTSGEPVSYTNWIPGHLNNFESHHAEDCIALIPYKNGVWDDIPCGDHFFELEFGEMHISFCEYAITGTVSGGVLIG